MKKKIEEMSLQEMMGEILLASLSKADQNKDEIQHLQFQVANLIGLVSKIRMEIRPKNHCCHQINNNLSCKQ